MSGKCGEYCVKVWEVITTLKAVIARLLFMIHGLVAIWRVVETTKDPLYWLLSISLLFLIVECVISLKYPRGSESKWFSPVFFLYLCSVIPAIWFLELEIFNLRLKARDMELSKLNQSEPKIYEIGVPKEFLNPPIVTIDRNNNDITMTTTPTLLEISLNATTYANFTGFPDVMNVTLAGNFTVANETDLKTNETEIVELWNGTTMRPESTVNPITNTTTQIFTEKSVTFKALGIDMIIPRLPPNQWAKILEQILMLFLIIGRWLLPKGDLTRDQLSQLLLVNIGMAADIIELFEAFREETVQYNLTLTSIILSLWTLSLCQFTLIMTATKARKSRFAITKFDKEEGIHCFCCETEVWSILTVLFMQDMPFFCLRMTLIFHFNVVSYLNIFFTCKNTLVILLQFYRIVVVHIHGFQNAQVSSSGNELAANPTLAFIDEEKQELNGGSNGTHADTNQQYDNVNYNTLNSCVNTQESMI